MTKGCKTENKGVLETVSSGPVSIYGQSDHERECIEEAKRMLLEAKESLAYRTKLLEALLSFRYREASNDSGMN
jgi:hypothetical protein